MLTEQERTQRIASIEALPSLLRELVVGASERQLDTMYRDFGWTARQVIHHLADSHINAYVRTRLILTENNPTLRPYSQDDWASLPDAAIGPIEPSLRILDGVHARWVALLRSVHETAWERQAHHPEYGATSLEGILETYSAHGEKHLGHIKTALDRRHAMGA